MSIRLYITHEYQENAPIYIKDESKSDGRILSNDMMEIEVIHENIHTKDSFEGRLRK
jgi:hypothetical protein